jgi:8-amino-7-oxononanoate synthase
LNDFLHKKLQERATTGALRVLHRLEGKIDFCSNDYLGLSSYKIKTNHSRNSGEGSRLIAGSSSTTHAAEITLATFFKVESALMFNSGYDANLGLFSSISTKNTLIIFDEYIHASVRDGIRLGLGKSFHFKHNDCVDLERIITANKTKFETIFVAIESLYSMGGDLSPLTEMTKICKRNGVLLIVDEAHAGGVFEKEGRGVAVDLAVENDVFARVFTFGKGYGSHGACVVGEKSLKKYLINFARSFIYTTALPASAYERVDLLFTNNKNVIASRRDLLQENIQFFTTTLGQLQLHSASATQSPIQILSLHQFDKVKLLNELSNSNFAVKPIFHPTVPVEKECLRICLHTFNTALEIKSLLDFLNRFVI